MGDDRLGEKHRQLGGRLGSLYPRLHGHVAATELLWKWLESFDHIAAHSGCHPQLPILMQLGRIQALIARGDVSQAVAALKQIAAQASAGPRLLQDVGQLFTYVNLHVDAERCYARAARIEPSNAAYLYN